ncbi:triple tyrosine motif-containing protein [Dysgonomonas sp. Marseille-P4361]|uniref:triple tyrosine motif-containing protein n=1 Tax=Dysgonomonas sp. Marseille-P4361 TaxID=2161820 RepID=UPI000D5584F4|nr:triple tyrosine motif-containing protein [Dysgonomonas sp. Marseille-P4361]
MKKTLILYLILITNQLSYSSNIWQREIINYDRKTYGAAAQNWMIEQSNKGWIYSANSEGLLEFDGIRWNLYEIENRMVRSIKVIDDRIYVGGSMEFGYFEADEIGKLNYTSLSKDVPSWGGDIWNILMLDNQIYFISDWDVFRYNLTDKTTTKIKCNYKINSSAIYKEAVVLSTENGIGRIDKTKSDISYSNSTAGLPSYKVVKLLPYKEGLMLVTSRHGVYYTKEGEKPIKLHLKEEDFINKNQIFSAAIVNSQLILGSVQSGILIIDIEGKHPSEKLDLNKGLRTNTVLNICVDRSNNLWLALDNGISFVDINSPVWPLFANVSPIGSGYCSILYNDRLYFGTNQGVYTFDTQNKANLINGTEGQIWSFNIIDDELFCSGDNGITVISKNGQYKINILGVWETHQPDNNKNTIIAGLYSGIAILERKNSKWEFVRRIETRGFMRGFVKGDDANTFFFLRDNKCIVKCTLNSEWTAILHEKEYPIEGGLVFENRYLSKINNQVTICTLNGIYVYDSLSDSFHKYHQLEEKLEGSQVYYHLSTDRFNNIWYSTDKSLKMLSYTQSGYEEKGKIKGPIIEEMIDTPGSIYALDSSNFIIGTENGFSNLNMTYGNIASNADLEVYIRRLSCGKQDSIISYGKNIKPLEIKHIDNSIKIEYSATQISKNSNIKYLFRLNNSEWSKPVSSTSKEYTNLYEGDYEFQVMAVDNLNGETSEITSINFAVLPPWYRTNIAYLSYFLILCIILYISYKLTISRQGKIIHQQKLESEMKDQEIYKLQNKGLKDELQYKTQELSGYILNLIRKNEMLEEVRRKAYNIIQAIDNNKTSNDIKQQTQQLIKLINNNLEKDSDFDVFQSNFNIVHQDFFNLLNKENPNLTRGEKILCAYLSMGLSTKEIAQLLNISVRGVEVNRYRLRKKIGLSRDENLTEYLQKIKDTDK